MQPMLEIGMVRSCSAFMGVQLELQVMSRRCKRLMHNPTLFIVAMSSDHHGCLFWFAEVTLQVDGVEYLHPGFAFFIRCT